MSMPDINAGRRVVSLALFSAGGLVVAAAVLLWVHYGTAVFLEMIRAGYAACFG